MSDGGLTRRSLLERAALGASSLALGSQFLPTLATAGRGHRNAIPLPSPAQVRTDFQKMVDFGPRLTGSDAHNRFIAWLEREFVAAGCELLPCDVYETNRWLAGDYGLELLEGPEAGPARIATYFPRSQETPAEGVTGPLVYAGSPPPPSLNGADLGALQAGLARYPDDLAGWASALPSTLSGSTEGSILLVDLPLPVPLHAGVFAPLITHYSDDESLAELALIDYKRTWLVPGLQMPLAPFAGLGAAGVVLILDASYEALLGSYLPFEAGYEDVPALYVDRDTGAQLRAQSVARPRTRLTLTATREQVPTPSVTAVLPGRSEETIIFNTHTDGQGFVEENGGVAFVQLARHFGSLPPAERLERTLVFAAWPGHMTNDLPQATGWIEAHEEIVERAAAALTVEHLGCSEWVDSIDKGYHATGQAELFAVWTNQGPIFEQTKAAIAAHDLPRTPMLRAPAQFGVGGPFHSAGIPQIGAIAGPEYLLNIVDDGDMDKLDAELASRQIAFVADLTRRLDVIDAAELADGDPTLGSPAPGGGFESSDAQPVAEECGPARKLVVDAGRRRRLIILWHGRGPEGTAQLSVWARGGPLKGISVELRQGGRTLARSGRLTVRARELGVVLSRPGGKAFADGRYTLAVRLAGKPIGRRVVGVA